MVIIARVYDTFAEAERLLERAGNYLCERALYERAEPLLQRVLSIREQTRGSDDPETARCQSILILQRYEQPTLVCCTKRNKK